MMPLENVVDCFLVIWNGMLLALEKINDPRPKGRGERSEGSEPAGIKIEFYD